MLLPFYEMFDECLPQQWSQYHAPILVDGMRNFDHFVAKSNDQLSFSKEFTVWVSLYSVLCKLWTRPISHAYLLFFHWCTLSYTPTIYIYICMLLSQSRYPSNPPSHPSNSSSSSMFPKIHKHTTRTVNETFPISTSIVHMVTYLPPPHLINYPPNPLPAPPSSPSSQFRHRPPTATTPSAPPPLHSASPRSDHGPDH